MGYHIISKCPLAILLSIYYNRKADWATKWNTPTKYPGVAQLVARLLWVDRWLIHSPEIEIPEVFGTVVYGGNSPVGKLLKNRAWPQHCPQTRKACFSLLCMVSCRKIKYPGVAYRSGTCFGSKLRLVRLQSLGPWVSPIRAHPFFNNLQISFESGTEMYNFFLFAAYM